MEVRGEAGPRAGKRLGCAALPVRNPAGTVRAVPGVGPRGAPVTHRG